MASTNKTTNYDLSQYVGSDKPTYLGDYNSDMLKIDTQMKANNDLATSANSTATTANQTAGTALTNANNAQTTADTANTTATSALNKATANEVNINKFNLTEFKELSITTSDGARYGQTKLYLATNNDKSIFKLYGEIDVNNIPTATTSITITTEDTGLRPDEAYNIEGLGIKMLGTGITPTTSPFYQGITVNTNGTITITASVSSNTYARIIFFPCLLFNTNFGDVPTPE